MASNQYVNKVVFGNDTLIDLTSDTATADKVLSGYYFHLKSGERTQGSCSYDADTSDATATDAEILSGSSAYVAGNKITGAMTNQGAVTLTIDDVTDEIAIPAGYHDGSGKAKLDSTEAGKLLATNIKSGVSILGVTGSYSGEAVSVESNKNATPSTSQQVITPSSGYDYLAQVTVAAIPYVEADNLQGGKTVTIGSAA